MKSENLLSGFDGHVQELVKKFEPLPHDEILASLLTQISKLDFKSLAYPEAIKFKKKLEKMDDDCEDADEIKKRLEKMKITAKHHLVLSVENALKVAEEKRWGLCKNHDFIYLFNSTFWANIDKDIFQKFLGEASEKMGVAKFSARYYLFREQLYKQFLATAHLPKPVTDRNKVLINLLNGTFEITPDGNKLRAFEWSDFITYQLPFRHESEAKYPIFQEFLDRVLPDKKRQMILAEYLGFVFIKHGSNAIKEEKALILYGTGANGKSVFFEVVNALLGAENVSSYSLQSLTNDNGYYRAKLANKLVNYASEINTNLEASIFKQLVSGEPVEARLPYGEPFMLTHYAKLIFNSNELPKDVEHTTAYFRRFLIIPFDVTIPEDEQDKQLHTKIIDSELSGVFNWVLDGLSRLLSQKRFTHCEAVKDAIELYKNQSDSAKMFLQEYDYSKSANESILIKELYIDYRAF